MDFTLSQYFEFEEAGPSILMDIRMPGDNMENAYYIFRALNHPTIKEFHVRREGLAKSKPIDTNFCRYIEDLSKAKKGDEVFIFMNARLYLAEYRSKKGNMVTIWLSGEKSMSYDIHESLVIYYFHEYAAFNEGLDKCSKCGATLKNHKGVKNEQATS